MAPNRPCWLFSMHCSLVEAGLKARFLVANVQESATLYEMVVAHDPGGAAKGQR